jgi:outer membrane protein TolC
MSRSGLLVLLGLAASGAHAQDADSLRLGALQVAAERQDPRAVQPALLERASSLRLENLRAQRLPQLALTGQASYQSAAFTLPFALPGAGVPEPPLERFQVQAEADQLLYDGGRLARRADVERAALAEQRAGVAVSLYALRQAVTEMFFAALLFDVQAATLALQEADLAVRLELVETRIREGAALPADAAALEAEAIRVRQAREEAEAGREAALDVLGRLVDVPVAGRPLALPDLDAALPLALTADTLAARPELGRFRRTQARLEAEARLAESQARPQVSLFGQAGVGRPSPFEPISDEAKAYGLVGLRLRWAPFDWGQAARTAEAARLQAESTAAEAAAFEDQLDREVQDELATVVRLERALEQDARAVALREEVLRTARRQLEEGVLLPADYADRLSDLTEARLARERHRIERARAQARILTTLGHPLDAP